jgi:MFS transporter, PAT family, beta-lactamase induction signal transducer AmpG
MEPSAPPVDARPWRWIPTLYFGQGLPYVAVMTLAVVMYKNLGVSNTDIALYTSWLYLPWVIKPFWSPLVELWRTKRWWIVAMQWLLGAAFAAVALAVPAPHYLQLTLAAFWLMAFSSATHDIAADGFYLLALPQRQQAAFVGVRSTFYRLAMIAGQGALVYLAGALQVRTGSFAQAWAMVFGVLAAAFVLLALWHGAVLPAPPADRSLQRTAGWGREFAATFAAFFRKPRIVAVLAFLLLYRFAESQLLKLAAPFLLDAPAVGGLGLSTQAVGVVYGTVGVAALTAGGLVGGWAISRAGLAAMLWPMVLAMNVPNAVYVALAVTQPAGAWVAGVAIAIEQLGYGFGFTAYLVVMMRVAEGEHRTAHYAICTGFMALGMMLPGMAAGWLQAWLGYPGFFTWVCAATIPSFVVAALLRIEPQDGERA